jgi:hypothetical protein
MLTTQPRHSVPVLDAIKKIIYVFSPSSLGSAPYIATWLELRETKATGCFMLTAVTVLMRVPGSLGQG